MPLPVPPDRPRRVAFLGTPEMAVPPLRAIVDAGLEVPLVVSRPDRRRGRGSSTTPSPVKAAALELGLPVSEDVDDLLPLAERGEVDVAVVVAFGQIIRPHVLAIVPMVNLHFSKLPRWRGAAPVERAILAGDTMTGACVMAVEEGLDTGGVYRWVEVGLGDDEDADELRERLVHVGTGLLVECLLDGLGEPLPQEGEPTYAHKIRPEELELDWSRRAIDLHRQVRVGGAWTRFRGRRLKVWRAALATDGAAPRLAGELAGTTVRCGEGALTLLEVQPEGKGRVDAGDWVRGARPEPTETLGR